MKFPVLAFAVLLLRVLAPAPLSAQQTAAVGEPLEVTLTPYVWALALDGHTTVSGNNADVDVTFNDIVDDLDGAIMLDAEIRKGRFGVILEGLYAKLSDNGASGDDRIRIDADINQALLNAAGTYRLGTWTLADWQQTGPLAVTVDPYAGARFTYLDLSVRGRLDLPDLGLDRKRTESGDKAWVDPIIGLRTIWTLGDRWEVVLAGDIGGTDPNEQYSAEGFALAGYRFGLFGDNNARVLAGYRALHQKYEDGSGDDAFKWDVTMHGPIVGLSVAF